MHLYFTRNRRSINEQNTEQIQYIRHLLAFSTTAEKSTCTCKVEYSWYISHIR